MTNTQNQLVEFIKANNLTHIMKDVFDYTKNSTGEITNSFSYAKTKKEVILKYFIQNKNFALQVEGVDKSISQYKQDGTENKLFTAIIEKLKVAQPVEQTVDTYVEELDLF